MTSVHMPSPQVTSDDRPPEMEDIRAAAEQRPLAPVSTEGSDTEPDADAEPAGAGLTGFGARLMVGSGPRRRPLCDGAGLCSPGLWPPQRRPEPADERFKAMRDAIIAEMGQLGEGANGQPRTVEIAEALAGGRIDADPFPLAATRRLQDKMVNLFGRLDFDGLYREQPIDVLLIGAVLRAAGDPDWRVARRYAVGIPNGVHDKLPRTPAVYARKTKWRLEEQRDPDCWCRPSSGQAWRDNYASARAHADELQRQQDEHVAGGLAERLSAEDFARDWPGCGVASLGAVVKTDQAGAVIKVRPVYDGSHGMDINSRIRVRDQDRSPTAGDIKRLQRESNPATAAFSA